MQDAFFHLVPHGSYLQGPRFHLNKSSFVLPVGSLNLILLFDDDLHRYTVRPETN